MSLTAELYGRVNGHDRLLTITSQTNPAGSRRVLGPRHGWHWGHLSGTWNSRPNGEPRSLETIQRLDNYAKNRVETWYLEGQAYRVMERYSDAICALDRAAELDHDNIHVWLALGWCHKRTGRMDKAIEALEEALQVNDRQAIVHYNLACYWSLVRNVKFAIRFLEQAFELDPAYRDLVASEHDFDPIREHPRFQELMSVIV